MKLLKRLWNDEIGAVISTELVLVSSVGVVGLLSGLQTVRDTVVGEMTDLTATVQRISQSNLRLADSLTRDDAMRDGRSEISAPDEQTGCVTLVDPQDLP